MKVFILSILFKNILFFTVILILSKGESYMTKLEKIQLKLKELRLYREYLLTIINSQTYKR